jgi:hypothetical protein
MHPNTGSAHIISDPAALFTLEPLNPGSLVAVSVAVLTALVINAALFLLLAELYQVSTQMCSGT